MKIAIIFPPYNHKKFSENLEVVDEEFGVYPPLGPAYAAAILEKAGHNVILIDTKALKLSKKERALNDYGHQHYGKKYNRVYEPPPQRNVMKYSHLTSVEQDIDAQFVIPAFAVKAPVSDVIVVSEIPDPGINSSPFVKFV